MSSNAPGKHYRKGISLIEAVEMFADPDFTEAWFIEQRWPNGVECPGCSSKDIQHRTNRKPQPFRCNDCRKDFSVKSDTIMHASKLPLKAWGMALYLLVTNLKGVSSMKLHRDLGITQKTAWHLAHRIRQAWVYDNSSPFTGPIEADETYIGAKAASMHKSKKLKSGRGTVGKAPVLGLKDRATNQVKAHAVRTTDRLTVQSFILDNTDTQATIYTDDAVQYRGIPRKHESIAHSVGEYVRAQATTNGIESFWAMFKRGQDGVYHHFSVKHLDRYLTEFAGRHNSRPLDTEEQMALIAQGMNGKRLRYDDLVGAA